MANIRLLEIKASDSRIIKARFSSDLSLEINASNVLVEGIEESIPNAQVRSVSVSNNILIVNTLPMTPYARYKVTFKSIPGRPFKSANGSDFLLQDGVANIANILGAENPSNIYRDNMISDLAGQPYTPEKGTLIRDYFNEISNSYIKTRSDIRQTKNDNYLGFNVFNERKQRSYGPFDRLNEEGAFEVFKVSLTQEGKKLLGKKLYDNFPSGLISLQGVSINDERLSAGLGKGTFNRFILSLNNFPVIKVNAIKILYQNGDVFNYNIRSLGYQIKDPKYDEDFASTFLTLDDNQIKLNDEVLEDPDFKIPEGGDFISIDYEYKSIGKFIDEDTVEVSETIDVVRKATPALANEFSLGVSPIVNSSNEIPTLGGIVFLDPNSETPFKTTHKAFLRELPFTANRVPKNPGEYSVDYKTGRVFVYGEQDDDGTGVFPPAVTFKYRKVFRNDLDYTYRHDTSELVASPLRDLAGRGARITFNYEQTLVEGVDYKLGVHNEELSERVENRLLSSTSLRVKNSPITNVFRIFNETTGEIYRTNRFIDDKIVFSANTPPSVGTVEFERATFENVSNEQMIVSSEMLNSSTVRIYKINLLNKNIMSSTDDVIGSSYNSSVSFSRNDIFENELFFESQLLNTSTNIDKLTVGDYQVDYRSGIVYVAVSNAQDFAIGTVNYKKPVVKTKNPHIISISGVYYSINPSNGVNSRIGFSDFSDDTITPSFYDISDERFLNGDVSIPYVVSAGNITVSHDIKTVRHVFDNQDLLNNQEPVDFGPSSSSSGNTIILDPSGVGLSGQFTVDPGLEIDIDTGSPGISLNTVNSIIRVSDGVNLLDGYQTILGNTITLSAGSGASVGDVVKVVYTVVLNTSATPIVDYNRGGHYIDYTYVADEIIVSYEYGDNFLDFRESSSLEVGQEYFVNYRVGALRDSLLENFGSSIDIPELNTFTVDLNRERYRDALIGALQSFTKGPTKPAMKSMISEVTKVDPDIVEAIFQFWSLGVSPMFQVPMKLNCPSDEFNVDETVNRTFVPGVFDNGYLPTKEGDFIKLPVSSNIRLNEGTIELDIIPQWDGLDNDAVLTFGNLKKDGYTLSKDNIFIGSSSVNPEFDLNGKFTVSRFDDAVGLPSATFTKTGIFIYYDDQVKKWNVLAKDRMDGYKYTGSISSSGGVYDVKKIPGTYELNDVIRSSENNIDFEFNLDGQDLLSPDGYSATDGYISGFSFDGISFMADSLHYILDFAETSSTNRFSLYKDGRGYINFAVWDKGGGYALDSKRRTKYVVSHDIQNWQSGEKHNLAIAWKLNTKNNRDEMHLFVDGFEVPNIIRYGGIPSAVSTDRFRTVQPELIAGTVPKNTVTGTAVTVQGSNEITANGVDFGIEGIVIGDTIEIKEQGFTTYNITNVNGPNLELDSAMPASLADAVFTVNPYSVVVSTEIDIYKNIIVSVLSGSEETEIPGLRADIPSYSISKNALNQNVLTILGNAEAGSQILIRTLGLNHRRCREKVYLWNDQSLLNTQLPTPINLDEVSIRSVLLPYVVVGPDNAAVVGSNFNATFNPTQPSNSTEGRQLEIRVSGGNVDFSTNTTVTINGTSDGGPSEVLTFSEPGKKISINKWQNITSIDIVTKPVTTSIDGVGVEIKEAFSVTKPNGNNIYPVIRFGFQTQAGLTLEGDGSDIVSDDNGFFPESDVGNLLVIESPGGAAGTFKIEEKIDNKTVKLDSAIGSAFTGGKYKIFNISIGRSGFQNGFFFLEQAGTVNVGYNLPKGFYEFDFSAYLEVPFDPVGNLEAYLGSDFNGKNQANAVIDEFRILNTQLTDTRVGETIGINERSVTTGANKIKQFTKDAQTLALLHFDSFPLENDVDYYTFAERKFLQSSSSVNSNFGQSICFDEEGLSFDNKNRLTTKTEGTIEFWVSPMFDTFNDPVPRVYFDAASSVFEEATSITKGTVKVSGRVGEVLSVRLATDESKTGIDYFVGGNVESDFQTISLGTELPFQQTPVIVTYIPNGVIGDRITILKDSEGFISFNILAGGELFQVRQPVFWPRNTWHRVKATFKFNTSNNQDEIRLFIDGEERGSIRFGEGILFGEGFVFGATVSGVTDQILIANIDFKDLINRFHIGQDFTGSLPAKARIDNFRLSNKSLNPITIGGQPKDVNFSNDVNCVFPVVENAYTTMLLDFNRIIEKIEDFSILRDSTFGIFNFTINIIDSFGIVEDSERVKAMLEAMISALKPANAKVNLNYIK